jgi:hypothetical protein
VFFLNKKMLTADFRFGTFLVLDEGLAGYVLRVAQRILRAAFY